MVGAAFYPGRSRFREEKSVLFFLFFKKNVFFRPFCFFVVFCFFVFLFLCFCVFVFLSFYVFVFLCLCLCFFVFFVFLCFLGVQPARLKGPTERPEKGAPYGGGALKRPQRPQRPLRGQ